MTSTYLPISAISRNVWRMCLEKGYRGCLGGRSQRGETTQKWWRWLRWRCPRRQGSRVATDTPFIIIMDSNRFLVLRSIGNGAAIQAAAHPRHRISHDGSSPQALGGMWVARGVANRNTRTKNALATALPTPATLPYGRKSSHVTPGRPCHMLPWGPHVICYPRAGVSHVTLWAGS